MLSNYGPFYIESFRFNFRLAAPSIRTRSSNTSWHSVIRASMAKNLVWNSLGALTVQTETEMDCHIPRRLVAVGFVAMCAGSTPRNVLPPSADIPLRRLVSLLTIDVCTMLLIDRPEL